jgi:4'-phosphopantetheinyl transferase
MPTCVTGQLRLERLSCSVPPSRVPEVPSLASDCVHVWLTSEVADVSSLQLLGSLLSPEERQRAARFRFDKDRNLFVAARGWLRALSGAYTNSAPTEVAFRYSARGKPELSHPGVLDLRFNVSHSGQMIVLAFARGRRVGVDVEEIRKDFSIVEIAERFFSPTERAGLRNLPATARDQAFFRCWTRKEAYIKATGDGLSLPLEQFDVSLAPNEPAQLLETRPDPAEAERWSMWDLGVGEQYAAAVVVERNSPSGPIG